jgi:hypothetical protein
LQVFLQIALPTLYDSWSDTFLSNSPQLLVSTFEPFVSRLYHEMEKTLKSFVSDFETLHRSALNGSSNKLFTDPAEKSAVSAFSKLRKDKDVDLKLLSKISSFALARAKCLWEEVYSDSVFKPLINYTCHVFGIPFRKFSSFLSDFPLSKLPTDPIAPYKPTELTKEDRDRDMTAKSQVN